MNSLDKTLLVSSENDLKLIYEEEIEKLRKNEFIMKCLQDLNPDVFPIESRNKIEKSLLALKISDHVDLGSGHKLLNLTGYDHDKIKLSYSEQKMIKEHVEDLIRKEQSKRRSTSNLREKILKERQKLFELESEARKSIQQLETLKKEQFDLMKELADVLVGNDQKNVVQAILEETEIKKLQLKSLISTADSHEMNKTSHTKKAFSEITDHLDSLLLQKDASSK